MLTSSLQTLTNMKKNKAGEDTWSYTGVAVSIFTLLISIIWFIREPGFEPLLVALGTLFLFVELGGFEKGTYDIALGIFVVGALAIGIYYYLYTIRSPILPEEWRATPAPCPEPEGGYWVPVPPDTPHLSALIKNVPLIANEVMVGNCLESGDLTGLDEIWTPILFPTATPTSTPEPTFTPEPTATSTPEPTATSTPEPTATSTPEPTATSTPTPGIVITIPPDTVPATSTPTLAGTIVTMPTSIPPTATPTQDEPTLIPLSPTPAE